MTSFVNLKPHRGWGLTVTISIDCQRSLVTAISREWSKAEFEKAPFLLELLRCQ